MNTLGFARALRCMACLMALWAVGGCASLDRSLSGMALSHNQTLDEIERGNLLLNVLRAADREPMSFTTLSYVSGNGSVGGSGSANSGSGRLLGLINGISSGASLSVNQGFGYSMTSLDNEQFNRSFLADIPLDRLLFLSEGTSLDNHVLYTLTIKRLLVAGSKQDTVPDDLLQNKVSPAQWDTFQTALARVMALGLSMEMAITETPVGPLLSRDEATYQLSSVVSSWNPSVWGVPQAGTARPLIKRVANPAGEGDRTYQLVMVGERPRFCYVPPNIRAWPAGEEKLCRTTGADVAWRQARSRSSAVPSRPAGLVAEVDWELVDLRSPREVFQFVGDVVRLQMEHPARVWMVGDAQVDPARAPRPLFSVVCSEQPSPSDALAKTQHRGRYCHVPRNDGSHSATVLQYLALLFTMSKVPGAIPASPGVVIR